MSRKTQTGDRRGNGMTIRSTHERMNRLSLNQSVLDLITPQSKEDAKPMEFNNFGDVLKAAYESDGIMVNRLGEIVKKKG